jgi:hypothetical protein
LIGESSWAPISIKQASRKVRKSLFLATLVVLALLAILALLLLRLVLK